MVGKVHIMLHRSTFAEPLLQW